MLHPHNSVAHSLPQVLDNPQHFTALGKEDHVHYPKTIQRVYCDTYFTTGLTQTTKLNKLVKDSPS